MANRVGKSRAERSNALALLASFLVVLLGLAAALLVCTISAPDPGWAMAAAVAVFALIAALPLSSMRARQRVDDLRPKENTLRLCWLWLCSRFRRADGGDATEPKVWKRKRVCPGPDGGVFRPDVGDGRDHPPCVW